MVTYTTFVFFLLYFGVTYVFYTFLPPRAKWISLLIGSYVFYFISARGNVVPLLVSTVLVWLAGIFLQRLEDSFKEKKKGVSRDEKKALKKKYNAYKGAVLAAGVVSSVGILLVCKYSNFFIETANSVFSASFDKVKTAQPLGISFYTLQAVSYLVDVYRGKYEAQKNPLRVSLYLSFMLTIIEGPIARYDDLGVQLQAGKSFDAHSFELGGQRIIWGIFKKVVVADRAAEFVNCVFDNDSEYTGAVIVVAIVFYTIQLYLEFSGVMDIVCGLGGLMGIKLPENFERPFFSKSINEFWQRWHITLGAFLRDYIFYSISFSKPFMNAVKSARKKFKPYYANLIPTSVALFFVWFANGFWHGSGWKYIVYGLYYYVLMMLGNFAEPLSEKLCSKLKINRKSKGFGIFRVARTVVIVNIGMLIFRAETLFQAWSMLSSVFKGADFAALLPGRNEVFGLDVLDYIIIIVSTLLVFAVSIIREKGTDVGEKITKLPFAARFTGYLAAVLIIIILGAYGEGYGVIDLIYANF